MSFGLPQRFLTLVAVKLFAASVPFADDVVSNSQTKIGSRETSSRRVSWRSAAHSGERLLGLAPLGDVHERDHHAVDLVLAVRYGAEPDVEPAPVAAVNLAPDRREIRNALRASIARPSYSS